MHSDTHWQRGEVESEGKGNRLFEVDLWQLEVDVGLELWFETKGLFV